MSHPYPKLTGKEMLDWIKSKCEVDGKCWLWAGALNHCGHPIMRLPGDRKSGCKMVRRVSLEASGKTVAPRHPVVTTCGNDECCNPAHLKQVTIQKMCQAAAANGAWQTPARAAKIAAAKRKDCKLTMEQAQEIRLSTESGPILAERYGVNRSLINGIKRGERWKDFSSPWAGLMASNNDQERKRA